MDNRLVISIYTLKVEEALVPDPPSKSKASKEDSFDFEISSIRKMILKVFLYRSAQFQKDFIHMNLIASIAYKKVLNELEHVIFFICY